MSKARSNMTTQGWQVTAPASSANLGCAFDCAALALRLYLRASFVPSSGQELTVTYHGPHSSRVPLDSSNQVVRAMQLAAGRLGTPPPRGHIELRSEIPVAAGLGSSAAAAVAGLLLGASYCGAEVTADELIGWAMEIEGHFDNAAAARCGGLVFAWNNAGRIATRKANFPEELRLVLVVPRTMVRTSEARQVLPSDYSRSDALHNMQRAAMLAATCFSGEFRLLPELFDDRLHQPYRQRLVPGIERCLRYRHEGLRGVAISGSGSAVIAIAGRSYEDRIALDLQAIFAEEGVQSDYILTSADNQGAVVTALSAGDPGLAGAARQGNP